MKFIRHILGFNVQEMADFMGVTRQTINNLETNKSPMSISQYIVFCAIIDNKCKYNSEALRAINAIIRSNSTFNENVDLNRLYDGLFLEKWFSILSMDNLEINKNEIEFNNSSELFEEICDTHKIFVSYDALMMPDSNIIFDYIVTILKKYEQKLIIPIKVIEKIQNISDQEDNKLSMQAKHALVCIENMKYNQIIKIRGEEGDSEDINDLFIELFNKYSYDYNLALITQSKFLVHTLINENDNNLFLKIDSMNKFIKWNKQELDNSITEIKEIYDSPISLIGWEIL
ncbi:MAG: hypothetical protein R3Y64_03905 [Peptostreptococcaceae bacterium]